MPERLEVVLQNVADGQWEKNAGVNVTVWSNGTVESSAPAAADELGEVDEFFREHWIVKGRRNNFAALPLFVLQSDVCELRGG
jgi:hypothetical protein